MQRLNGAYHLGDKPLWYIKVGRDEYLYAGSETDANQFNAELCRIETENRGSEPKFKVRKIIKFI